MLDVAAGRGAILIAAADKVGADGYVIGIDLAEGMVQETAAEIGRKGLTNATMRQMDAEHLAFGDASFDYVLCGFAIGGLDLDRTLLEFYRVLRPGGKVAMTVPGGSDGRWRWYNDLLLSYHDVYQIPLRPPRRGTPWEPSDLDTVLTRAGFVEVQATIEEQEFVYADEEEWWISKWTHGARYPLERMQPELLERFKSEVFARLEPLKQLDGFHEVVRMLCVIGTKPRQVKNGTDHG